MAHRSHPSVLSSLAVAFVCASAFGQTRRTVPDGFATTRGNRVFYHWSASAGRVLQVVDRSNTAPMSQVRQLAFRRHASAFPAATSGTADVEVTMAQADWARLEVAFAKNHRAATKIVHASKRVNVPDWRAAPKDLAFDFVIKFDAPWSYAGRTLPRTPALVWTVRYASSTAGRHQMDRYEGRAAYTTGTRLGTGCGGYTQRLRFINTGPHAGSGMHIESRATGAPKFAPVVLFMDVKDSDLTVPALCTKLRALPVLVLGLGVTDANGELGTLYLTLPHVPAIEGVTLFTQLVSPDGSQPGLPFALSEGRQLTVPRNASTNGVATCYLWAPGARATSAVGDLVFFGGAPIAEVSR